MSAFTLSVVVVALNESDNLEKTIDCLQPTLPESSELLVIDDGSTDGCSDFLSGRSGVTLYRTDQIGIARARNIGAARTQGEIVVFSDAHVDVPPGWWSPLAAALQTSGIGAAGPAICDMTRPDWKGYGYRFEGPDLLEMSWMPRKKEEPYEVPQLCGCFIAFRRDVLDATGGFDAGMIGWGLNDSEFCMRLWALGYDLAVVPEVEVLHLFREKFPYSVDWASVTHNALRLSMVHFGPDRLAQVVAHYASFTDFPRAMALVMERDVCGRRREIAERRVRDGESLFRRFGLEW
jgi:GT2 family glycosyltransferase